MCDGISKKLNHNEDEIKDFKNFYRNYKKSTKKREIKY